MLLAVVFGLYSCLLVGWFNVVSVYCCLYASVFLGFVGIWGL